MEIIILIIVMIIGIVTVNNRAESEGLGSALKSLLFLFLALVCALISLTGVGAIIGIPLLGALAKGFSKKV